jgi:hypothetical protein
MGRFLDRLTGTRQPPAGVAPLPPERVHAALLRLNGPDVPYLVRSGRPEGVDLIAELKIADEYWLGVFSAAQVTTQFQIKMHLDHDHLQVRSTDEMWEFARGVSVDLGDGRVGLTWERSHQQGQIYSTTKTWTFGKGGFTEEPDLGYSSQAVRSALRERVLSTGWGWRAMVFGS